MYVARLYVCPKFGRETHSVREHSISNKEADIVRLYICPKLDSYVEIAQLNTNEEKYVARLYVCLKFG